MRGRDAVHHDCRLRRFKYEEAATMGAEILKTQATLIKKRYVPCPKLVEVGTVVRSKAPLPAQNHVLVRSDWLVQYGRLYKAI
jgi:hypothetical protein